ncbi:MAG: MFS transporter [Proteobacteria bacterium]|nr:MFS transporter [Pseudomonadota bacterium]
MRRTIIVLGVGQTLTWASSYYLVAILAVPIARDIGFASNWVFGAFSAALLISAVLGPRIGRTIDSFGGRGVLSSANLVIAVGLVVLAMAQSVVMVWAAWLILGVGMGLGLYDAAFAALGRIYGDKARRAITGITLIAGFASTVGWPLTQWGLDTIGWRETCLVWAAANVLIGFPMSRFLIPKTEAAPPPADGSKPVKPHIPMDRSMWLLGFAFASAWIVTAAMAVHLPRMLETAGATTAQAIAAGAMIGPAQVAARLLEAGFLSKFHALVTARLAAAAHPVGVGLLFLLGGAFPYGFAVLHGAGNGILTIARGTVPLSVFGPENYGYRLGLLGAPARIGQAGAPLLFGFLIDEIGTGALYVSSGLSLAALAAFCILRAGKGT